MYSIKDKIVGDARLIFDREYKGKNRSTACLYWARSFDKAARAHGLQSLMQAGSAMFQFRADDGKAVTHFSYVFDQVSAFKRICGGLMPEIHVWNALRDTREIVDLTTGYQAKQAQQLIGERWGKDFELPDYFWGKPNGDGRMIYIPSAAATFYVLRLLGCEISNRIAGDTFHLHNYGT